MGKTAVAKDRQSTTLNTQRAAVRGLDVSRVMELYPRIYFACHTRHVRDPRTQEEISRHQASILDHLDRVEGISLLQLADHMGVTASTMSLNIDRLETRGYVSRQRDAEDRRRVLLRLTAKGTKVTEAQTVLDPRLVKNLLAELPKEKRAKAIEGLQLLAAAAAAAMKRKARKGREKGVGTGE